MKTEARNLSAPFLASGSVTLGPSESGVVDTQRTSIAFRKPIMLDEIRFQASIALDLTGNLATINLGDNVRARIQLGRFAMSNSFVPIWHFGSRLNLEHTVDSSTVDLGVFRTNISHFRWRLPRPMFIPAGQSVITEFFRTPLTQSALDATCWVSYAGRYLAPDVEIPKETCVPYVTAYLLPQLRSAITSVATGQSGENDLYNPFSQPFHVQRAIGRLLQVTNDGGAVRSYLENSSPNANAIGALANRMNIKMWDSYGREIANAPPLADISGGSMSIMVPFNDAFVYPRAAWTFHRTMSARERYYVQWLDTNPENVDSMTPSVSIVGWRKETL